MNFNAEQFTATQQANLNVAAGLSQSAFAGFERLVELNMAAGKAAVGESFANMQALMAAKSPQDLMAVQAALVQPAFEKSVSYSRHLTDIANSTGAEFTKAVESKMAESEQAVKSLIESSLKNAPAGSDAAVAVIKTAFEASQSAAAQPAPIKDRFSPLGGGGASRAARVAPLRPRRHAACHRRRRRT